MDVMLSVNCVDMCIQDSTLIHVHADRKYLDNPIYLHK